MIAWRRRRTALRDTGRVTVAFRGERWRLIDSAPRVLRLLDRARRRHRLAPLRYGGVDSFVNPLAVLYVTDDWRDP